MSESSHAESAELSRRQVLQVGAMGVLGVAGIALASTARGSDDESDEKSAAKYIDAHSHIWTRDVEKFPLAEGKTVDDLDPASFTDEELLEVARPEGVGRVVLIQHHIYHGWDNTYLIDAAERRKGIFSVVGMVDDTRPDPERVMRELLPRQVRGLRITSWIRKEKWLDGPGMAAMWKCAAETGQAMCCLIDPPDLPGVAAMCERNPDTAVVIDHFARIGVDGEIRKRDVEALCGLARYKRTHLKLSAYYALGKKKAPYLDLVPMIRRVLDVYGVERCMWASDSPYQVVNGHTYHDSIALIRDQLEDLSDGDRDWLLRRTAQSVYFAF
jgi:predicted TIM-barrel fold metal-dependent hydrolase